MSFPDACVFFEFPLPDPEAQESGFWCYGIGGCNAEAFNINKEGEVFRGLKGDYLNPHKTFDLTGSLDFTAINGQNFHYRGYFINGRLQSIKKT
jgi:hypothetical protein